ncbi:retinal homeobox protein Rx3-like [Sphaeramia orbicularis]|uniref:retinal homeobox protein Rx3-like n=1 Tax=Sphaeramia orbicularis TaxID=375764 RepID=UPI00117EDADF|nr:retinal homeobox protein Rx3-like [Sphaeramia orbicularis]
MWLLGSPSQVMMDERMSPSARSVQSPGNPSTVHSIEAILGFREDAIFHKSTSYNNMTDKMLGGDVERTGNVIVTPRRDKSLFAETFDNVCCSSSTTTESSVCPDSPDREAKLSDDENPKKKHRRNRTTSPPSSSTSLERAFEKSPYPDVYRGGAGPEASTCRRSEVQEVEAMPVRLDQEQTLVQYPGRLTVCVPYCTLSLPEPNATDQVS